MTSVAAPKTVDELTSSSNRKSCIPCIIHSIASNETIEACRQTLQEAFDGYICLAWTPDTASACIQKRLPNMEHLCGADESVKMMIFPYLLLYLFGGIYLDWSVTCVRDVEALLYHYSSTILFFFMSPPQHLASRQLSFGVSSTLLASAPRIDAMYTLINIMGKQAESPSYAIEVHDGIVNQFVRAALNGSQQNAVLLLSDKYIHDETGKFNILSSPTHDTPELSTEITRLCAERIFINQSRVRVMKSAPSADAFKRVAGMGDATVVEDNDPVNCLILDTDFDAEKPVDASMDVALLLHNTQFCVDAFVILRKGCDSIAMANLKLLGAEQLGSDDGFSIWQLTTST